MKYTVELPFTGVAAILVEAESKDEAIEMAMNTDMRIQFPNTKNAWCDECEYHEKIVEGNIFFGVQNEIEVTEEDE